MEKISNLFQFNLCVLYKQKTFEKTGSENFFLFVLEIEPLRKNKFIP